MARTQGGGQWAGKDMGHRTWGMGVEKLGLLLALAHLKRLLQYLQGSVLGFCCRPSPPLSSAVPASAGASIDWMGIIMRREGQPPAVARQGERWGPRTKYQVTQHEKWGGGGGAEREGGEGRSALGRAIFCWGNRPRQSSYHGPQGVLAAAAAAAPPFSFAWLTTGKQAVRPRHAHTHAHATPRGQGTPPCRQIPDTRLIPRSAATARARERTQGRGQTALSAGAEQARPGSRPNVLGCGRGRVGASTAI